MKVLAGAVLGFMIVLVAAALVAVTGGVDVGATSPPSKFEQRVANYMLKRSVARRAPRTGNPLAASPEVWRSGLAHFKENCVMCHGAPGVEESEFGQGLNPPAPDLTLPSVQEMSDGQLFWIVSNGIRMTGMPAFSPTHKPEEVWKIVAFLRHLPELSDEEQKALKAGSEEAEQHHEAAVGVEKDEHVHAKGEEHHHEEKSSAKPKSTGGGHSHTTPGPKM
jgi:mono/diheme cytochrome c family protein